VENVVTVIGLEGQRRKIMLLLSHVVAEKIMILRSVLVRISCHVIRRKRRDLRNHGNSKTKKAGNRKKGLKEND